VGDIGRSGNTCFTSPAKRIAIDTAMQEILNITQPNSCILRRFLPNGQTEVVLAESPGERA